MPILGRAKIQVSGDDLFIISDSAGVGMYDRDGNAKVSKKVLWTFVHFYTATASTSTLL